jgi:hypothetical protein
MVALERPRMGNAAGVGDDPGAVADLRDEVPDLSVV